jgi:diaminopimelate epimerase
MRLKFSKMQGLGNDFVVIDACTQKVNLSKQQIQHLADRHFGIGCDQVLLVEPTRDADFVYRIFNANGEEAEQCGNGARCVSRFVVEKGLIKAKKLHFKTMLGELYTELIAGNQVLADMGKPNFQPTAIPLAVAEEELRYEVVCKEVEYQFSALSLGNPHAVLIVGNARQAPVATVGRFISKHELFPNEVNVEFMQIVSRSEIKLRVFERHVGETLACGSGACAAVAAGIKQGLLDNKVKVKQAGGELTIEWQAGQSIKMIGPAEFVFAGEIEL